jgi:mRNA interferase MazF
LGVTRGEIWWVDAPAPIGRRPVVLVSREQVYRVREYVTVVPLTRTVRNIPTEVVLGPEDGVPKRCVANADTVTTIDKRRIADFIGTLSAAKMESLGRAIKFALALS